MSTETAGAEPSMSDIEPILLNMRTTIDMLGHMAESGLDVEGDHLHLIENQLLAHQSKLHEIWLAAWKNGIAEQRQLRDELKNAQDELKKAKEEVGPLGSTDDLKRADAYWSILRTAAQVSLQACDARQLRAKRAKPPQRGRRH